MGKKKAIIQMSATQREWGNAVGRETGMRGRDVGRYTEHSSEKKGRKNGHEGRKERRERMVSIEQHNNAKKNRAILQKVLVGWNKGMRTCAHLMIKK